MTCRTLSKTLLTFQRNVTTSAGFVRLRKTSHTPGVQKILCSFLKNAHARLGERSAQSVVIGRAKLMSNRIRDGFARKIMFPNFFKLGIGWGDNSWHKCNNRKGR